MIDFFFVDMHNKGLFCWNSAFFLVVELLLFLYWQMLAGTQKSYDKQMRSAAALSQIRL